MPFRLRGSVAAGAVLAGACALGTLTGCGSQPAEDLGHVDASIIGGTLDTTHKGVVSLLKEVPGNYYPACSGTLLTQNLVLTAHHCVAALNSADGEKVDCGKTTFQDTDRASSMQISTEDDVGTDKSQRYKVSDVWVPIEGGAVCGTDVALLLLSGSGVPAAAATPIPPNLTKALAVNDVFAAIGYGLQDPNDDTGKTVGQRMAVLDATVSCEGTACGTDMIADREFGANSPTCSGDSGGPALAAGHVSGVTSRGDPECAHAIYSAVYAWGDFIRSKALVAAQSGNYTPPDWATAPPSTVTPTGGTNRGGTGGVGSGSGGASSAGTSSAGIAAGNGSTTVSGPTTTGGSATNSPVTDPLGLACTGQCPGAYKCWAETGTPPGICVPECSATQTTCPTDFTCDAGLGACTKQTKSTTIARSGSCSVSVAGTSTSTAEHRPWWLALGLFGFARRGRRAKRRAIDI